MGSQLSTLRDLLARQLDTDDVTIGSDPSIAQLNDYINKSIRKIVRRSRPRELMQATAISANIVAAANTVTIPATMFIPDEVYYKTSGGSWKDLKQRTLKDLIQTNGATNFFNTGNQGDPTYYAVRGTSLVFDKYFSRTEASAINIFGIDPPDTLSNDTDTTELPIDYDMLITYESAVLFAQRDDDEENIQRWSALAQRENSELLVSLDTNDDMQMYMDPNVFTSRSTNIANPSVFFSS